MNLLIIWHAGAIPQYFDRYRELAVYFDQVKVIVPKGWFEVPSNYQENEYVVISKSFGNTNELFLMYKDLKKIAGKFLPDFLYIHEEPCALSAYQAAIWAVKNNVPFVVDSAMTNKNLIFGGLNFFEKYVYRKAWKIYYRNEKSKQFLMARGCPKVKLEGPVPNGVSNRLFYKIKDKTLAENKIIGFAGRINKHKGVHLLLKYIQNHEDVILHICGKADDLELIRDIKKHERIRYFGMLDPHRLNEFYNNCNLLVLPSIPSPSWEEQFGRVLIEAIAAGTPAIGSDIGFMKNILTKDAVFQTNNYHALERSIDRFLYSDISNIYKQQLQRVKDFFGWGAIALNLKKSLEAKELVHWAPDSGERIL